VAGGGAKLWVTLVGRSKIRVGSPSTFNLDYGNTGLNDAYFARVFVRFPTASLTYQLGATLTQPNITGNPIDVSATPPDVQIGGNTVVPLIIPVVAAGASGSIPIIFTAPAVQSGIMLKTWVNPAGSASVAPVLSAAPLSMRTSGTISLWSMPQCYADMAQYAAQAFGLATPQQCWGVFPQNSQSAAANAVASIMNGNAWLNSFLMSLTQFLDQQDKAVDQCLQQNGLPQPNLTDLLDSTVTSIVNLVENTITKNDCKVEVDVSQDEDDSSDDDDSDSSTDGGGSIDPNDKTGPAGVTAARWVLNSQPLNYTVSFENEPAATFPAQQVVVIDKLDPAKVNLSTFSLGPMGFNRTVVAPPTSTTNYSATVDLRPGQDLLVQIQGSLNADTGVVKWTFRSLDPATNLPPADPSMGFLPPDTSPPAGDGFVVFSVMPKKHAPNGSKVTNQATVVFDSNAPIKTPAWSNLVARPVAQALSITPASLAFRHVPIFGTSDGTSPSQTVTLTNPGPQQMVVAGVSASSDFLVKPTACRTVLASGESCTFGVRFRPTDLGTTLGQLTISDNATEAPQVVALKGVAVPGALTFAPTSLGFGKVKLNTTSAAKKLTMTNATNAMAMIISVAPSAGFVTSNDHCTGVTLNPAQSCTVGVAFGPTGSAGVVKGDLTVTTDAEAQQVPLTGDATP